MVDSGKIIEYITKHFLPTPTLQMHFTSLNKPVHLTKKLNKSKCTSEDSRWFLLNTTKCTCYCLIQTHPPQLQLHENLLKRKINLHVQAKALISFAMHDWFLFKPFLLYPIQCFKYTSVYLLTVLSELFTLYFQIDFLRYPNKVTPAALCLFWHRKKF